MHARCLRLQRVVRGGFCYTLNDQLLLILQFICWKWTWLRWKRTSFCRKWTSIRRKWTSHRWKRTSLRRKRTSLFSFLKSIFDGWSPFSTAIYKWTWLFQSIVFLTDFTQRKCTNRQTIFWGLHLTSSAGQDRSSISNQVSEKSHLLLFQAALSVRFFFCGFSKLGKGFTSWHLHPTMLKPKSVAVNYWGAFPI